MDPKTYGILGVCRILTWSKILVVKLVIATVRSLEPLYDARSGAVVPVLYAVLFADERAFLAEVRQSVAPSYRLRND